MATISDTQTLRIPDSAEAIRDQLLTDVRLELRNVGITDPEASVAPKTDNYIWATAQANAGILQFAFIGQIRPSITPLFATGNDLERWRLALKLPVVQPTGATGRLTITVNGGASLTLTQGQQFTLPNGLRGQVTTTQTGLSDGSDVSVSMIDTGDKSNAVAGTIVRWVNPVFNLGSTARVSLNRPLVGGFDAETDSRKRERILNRLGNSPGGGNFGQLREIAFNALASVQNCFVYPALGGPSSTKVVVLKAFDAGRNDFSREFDESAAAFVRSKIQEIVSEGVDIPVTPVLDEQTSLAFGLTLPSSSLAGGNGSGWLDAVPWPQQASPGTPCTVSLTTSSKSITVTGCSAVAPIDGVTRVAWWSPQDMTFRVGLVTSHTGTGPSFLINLQDPFVDSTNTQVSIGDYISPPAERMADYRDKLLSLFEALAPGENTADVNRLPRAQRNPTVSDGGADSDITNAFATRFIRDFAEISDAEILSATKTTPTVPVSIDLQPNVLVPQHFGIYVQ